MSRMRVSYVGDDSHPGLSKDRRRPQGLPHTSAHEHINEMSNKFNRHHLPPNPRRLSPYSRHFHTSASFPLPSELFLSSSNPSPPWPAVQHLSPQAYRHLHSLHDPHVLWYAANALSAPDMSEHPREQRYTGSRVRFWQAGQKNLWIRSWSNWRATFWSLGCSYRCTKNEWDKELTIHWISRVSLD